MNHISSYPKIYALGHPLIKDLFNGEVIIEEKIDGSQFSFQKIGKDLFFRSKGVDFVPGAPEKMFSIVVENIEAIKDQLTEGYVYRGEYLRTPSHNTLEYERVPLKNFVLFDVMIGQESYMTYGQKMEEAARLGIETVPCLYQGVVEDQAFFEELLNRESFLGKAKIEGVVVKNYAQFGSDKKILCGKYVSLEFKEVHQGKWKQANPSSSDIVEHLVQQYKNKNRWHKALQHLRDEGKLTQTPKDIGALILEIQKDLELECVDEIKNQLYSYAISKIKRGCVGGVPEWYKEELLKIQFEKDAA